jgi:hypothetical protein
MSDMITHLDLYDDLKLLVDVEEGYSNDVDFKIQASNQQLTFRLSREQSILLFDELQLTLGIK